MRSATVSSSRPQLRFGAGLSRHFITLDPLTPSAWWAFAFTFALSAATLASVTVAGSSAIVAFLAVVALLVALFPSVAVKSTARNLILWAYPAWAILSIGWSTVPDRTVHSVTLIVPTVIAGLTLGGMRKRREVNLGAAAAMFVFIAAAVVAGGRTLFSDTGSGGEALTGFGSGKNFFGHLSAMSAIMSYSFFAFRNTRFGRILMLLGVADLAVSLFALVGSHATGALIAFLLATMIFLLVISFSRVSWQLRFLFLAVLIAVMIVYVTFGQTLQQMLFDTILQKFNKDTTLTGRTTLWDYADRLMLDHRMLGYGYGAFWFYTNPDAWTIWRMMGVQPMSGFNFHNTPREILIESGLAGFVIYVASFGWAFVRSFLASLAKGDVASGVRLAFVGYFIVRMPVESTGFAPTTVDSILLLAFLCVPVALVAKKSGANDYMPIEMPTRPAIARSS